MKPYKKYWLIYSITGLILLGAGLSISIDAGLLRAGFSKGIGLPWVPYGTLGLVVFNSGISFIGQAVIYKIKSDSP